MLDIIVVSLFGNVTVDTEEILIDTKIVRTKDPNNHSGFETGTLSRLCRLRRGGRGSFKPDVHLMSAFLAWHNVYNMYIV